MTAAVYEIQWRHPSRCDVCGGRQAVMLRFGDGPLRLRHLSVVIPCPHCTHAGELLRHLPVPGRPWGGDAA